MAESRQKLEDTYKFFSSEGHKNLFLMAESRQKLEDNDKNGTPIWDAMR